jgi:hypothetical protein
MKKSTGKLMNFSYFFSKKISTFHKFEIQTSCRSSSSVFDAESNGIIHFDLTSKLEEEYGLKKYPKTQISMIFSFSMEKTQEQKNFVIRSSIGVPNFIAKK